MSREEQIEEMIAVIRDTVNGCSSYWSGLIADALYEEGYRKQSEKFLLKENGDIVSLARQSEWISVDERLPEPEKEVLILAIRRYVYMGEVHEAHTITTAMYEDGTMSTEDSEWNWHDIDFIYDEENDVQYIPEGWWEYRHYNPDDVYNNAVDDKVTHWMPLPEAPKMKGGAE